MTATLPLHGVRVVELGGIGPAPFCAMVLADLGAEVIRVHRPTERGTYPNPVLDRGRRSLAVDLKQPAGAELVRDLIATSDVVIEGFRPGVAERLGFDPIRLRRANPRLVVGRMTGYGQDGPLAQRAGHDINYISLSGALGAMGRADERPAPPLNLVGDFGGGGMLLTVGVLAAVLQARATGVGQDVDASMVDGSALLLAMIHGFVAQGTWTAERGRNLLDSGAPFYDTYACADGRYVAVGAIEPQFFSALLEALDLTDRVDAARQRDPETWPHQRKLLTEAFARRTRDEWASAFAQVDACVTPVLGLDEAPDHPHLRARSTYRTVDGAVHPSPAPRFSAVGGERPPPPPAPTPGQDTDAILDELGLTADVISTLKDEGTVA